MKKIILSAIAVCAFGFANAQDLKSKKGENYLPEAGDWAISFQANPFLVYFGQVAGGNVPSTGGFTATSPVTNSFVGKKFITDKTATRYVANVGFGSNNFVGGAVPGGPVFATYKQSTLALSAGLGKEWRKGSTRLQGFYGADATINFTSTKWSETNNLVANRSYDAGTTLGLGLNGFIGAEYFILPKMSIGAQYNYGLNIASNGKSKYDDKDPATVDLEGKSTSNTNLGGVTSGSVNLTLHF
ncbi:MAG: hypothetical protein NTX74_08100 [Flavobacterium sp.]|nr:hypothetical protein [Flavobacterium sp.]